MNYTTNRLVEIGCLSNNSLQDNIINRVNDLGLSRSLDQGYKEHKKTRRGIRNKQKHNNKKNRSADFKHSINRRNLIYVEIGNRAKDLSQNYFTAAVFNCRSLKKKETILNDFVINENLDCLFLNETWLTQDSRTEIGQLKPTGFNFAQNPRSYARGGGVAVLFKKKLNFIQSQFGEFKTFEVISGKFKLQNHALNVYTIYRPPPNQKNGFTTAQFFDEFADFLTLVSAQNNIIIVGDFNIHIDDAANAITTQFLSILDSFGLKQHVNQKTHNKGHCLDLIITEKNGLLPLDIYTTDLCISDHFAVSFSLNLDKPTPEFCSMITHDRKNLDISSVKNDIKNFTKSKISSLEGLVEHYNNQLKTVCDAAVPKIKRDIVLKPNRKWYNANLRLEKVKKRRLERKFKKTGSKEVYLKFREQCEHYNQLCDSAKTDFFSSKIIESFDDKKKFFAQAKKLLNLRDEKIFPVDTSNLENRFSDFFVDKIVKIQSSINDQCNQIEDIEFLKAEISTFNFNAAPGLSEFRLTSIEEIKKVVSSMSSATCELDPIPTDILKLCLDEIAPFIVDIVNLSLQNAAFPKELKKAIVKPLLKKATLDPNILKNYRPVSNLSFISKIVEKVVANRLKLYLEDNFLFEPFQSAYREYHSVETALLKINNDLLKNLDNGKISALILTDLSAAFDTINHNLLLNRLKSRFGVTNTALAWFKSYLTGRFQAVKISGLGDFRELKWGVPQGSILGPILFTLYTMPLSDIARKYGISHHFYADDAQLYLELRNAASEECLQSCVTEFRSWMIVNQLKVNDDKTEILLVGSKFSQKKRSNISFNVGNETVYSSEKVKNLGVIFDNSLTMCEFINSKCSACFYYIREIAKIRKYLTLEAAKNIVQSYVISRLDFCNSILYGVNKQYIKKLQFVQNAAAKLIYRARKFDHVTPILIDLHWLPVEKRIVFKILVHVFNCLNNKAPRYLSELLLSYRPKRNLRSSKSHLIKENRVKTKYGSRAFENCGPLLWNSLPVNIRKTTCIIDFKKKLKTVLFQQAYNL